MIGISTVPVTVVLGCHLRHLRHAGHQVWPTTSASYADTSRPGPAGWKPTPTSASPTAMSSANWPGSDGRAAWPPNRTSRAGCGRRSARYRSRSGAGGPGGRPRPRSATAASATHHRSRAALGPPPWEPGQRAAYRDAQQAIGRVHSKQQRQEDRAHDPQPTHPAATADRDQQDPAIRPGSQRRGRAGLERAVG
jgi:hypothetical protein